MPVIVSFSTESIQSKSSVEIVERKGLGHPDTLCDALAEAASTTLCHYYQEHFGLILHHNVDKALLLGGESLPAFNGGQVTKPMDIFLAGRATHEFKGKKAPVEELIIETGRQWLKQHMHSLDIDHHIRLHSRVRPGSRELVELYLRQHASGIALANDTSCGVGYAPQSDLERLVLVIEQHLNGADMKKTHPEIGEDIKVMAVRIHKAIIITIGCAFVDQYITNMDDYQAKKAWVATVVKDIAGQHTENTVSVAVNTADGETPESIYLTVTGTSAEAGDDGEVGRGNRINGLITPYRPMNMEAAAGKNPVTHVGKLYNITAQRIAASVVDEIEPVQHAQCYLVSRIGQPITAPQVVDVKVTLADSSPPPRLKESIMDIVNDHLANISTIQDDIIKGNIRIF